MITLVKAWLAAERGDTRSAAALLEAGAGGEVAHGSAAALRGLWTSCSSCTRSVYSSMEPIAAQSMPC